MGFRLPTSFAAALFAAGAAQAQGCDAPLDAAQKLSSTPYRMTMETTGPSGNQTDRSEIISTTDTTYVRMGNSWRPGPRTAITLGDTDAVGFGDDALVCQLLRSETLAGAPTHVWQVDDMSDPRQPLRQTVWIAQDTGLIQRMEIREGAAAGRVSAEIDYKNVAAPR